MHYAVRAGNLQVVKLLLDEGADKTLGSNSGETPAGLALKHHMWPVLSLLQGLLPVCLHIGVYAVVNITSA